MTIPCGKKSFAEAEKKDDKFLYNITLYKIKQKLFTLYILIN